MKKKYKFIPQVKKGDSITGGSILGTVEETPLLTHSILVPPNHRGGVIRDMASEGDYDLEQVMARQKKKWVQDRVQNVSQMASRKPRPYAERYDPTGTAYHRPAYY